MKRDWSPDARRALLRAERVAHRAGSETVEPVHLGLALGFETEGRAAELASAVGLRLPVAGHDDAAGDTVPAASRFSAAANAIADRARREARKARAETVDGGHLLLALLAGGAPLPVLADAGFTYSAVARAARPAHPTFDQDFPVEAWRPGFLKGRDLLAVADLSEDEVRGIFELAREAKSGTLPRSAVGKTAALLFEKPSLRTKVSFQVAMTRLGGNGLYLGRDEVGLGKREAVRDVARTLSRMVDVLVVRTFDHEVLEELAHWADVPVVNALDDREHPCQALADFYTVLEHRGGTEGQRMVFVGDGNNVAVSLMRMAPLLGVHFTLACPPGYLPPADDVEAARTLAAEHGTVFEIVHDPLAAAEQADVLYTDVWVSMGQEEETARRRADFEGFRIDERLIARAKDDVLVLHCLPAHRGDEIDDATIEGEHSRVFDQAENRLHLQQALLSAVL